MLCIKNIKKILTGIIFALLISAVAGIAPIYAATSDYVYLGGFPVGFLINTQSVEVIGVCDVMCDNGMKSPARDCGIFAGDVIEYVNNIQITSIEKLNYAVNEDFISYKMGILRNGESYEVEIEPVIEKTSGKKRFGLLVKDSLNGIGTVTYIDKTNNKFGSLGHSVSDNNGNLIEINGGSIYGCSIYDIKKGLRGNPGELKGIFDNTCTLGSVVKNTPCGIYGELSNKFDTSKLKKIKIGRIGETTIGKAKIYSTLSGNESKEYDITIVKVDAVNKDNRNFVIKIEDGTLLEKCGGIVQGMSGSPIVQNGKLVGAVTHVFVNDPTRGYGISIENMLNSY